MQTHQNALFEEEPLAVMRLYGQGQVPLKSVAELVIAVDQIHRRIQAMDTFFILLKQGYSLPEQSTATDRLTTIVRAAESNLSLPQLKSVELHSPGFWEVLGSITPLKFITDCLHFWHERCKDKSYRNAAEASKLFLENQLKANEVLKQRVELMKSVGVTDDEIRQHFLNPVVGSVTTLYTISQANVIDPQSVQLKELPSLQAPNP